MRICFFIFPSKIEKHIHLDTQIGFAFFSNNSRITYLLSIMATLYQ